MQLNYLYISYIKDLKELRVGCILFIPGKNKLYFEFLKLCEWTLDVDLKILFKLVGEGL